MLKELWRNMVATVPDPAVGGPVFEYLIGFINIHKSCRSDGVYKSCSQTYYQTCMFVKG